MNRPLDHPRGGIKVINITKDKILAESLSIADTTLKRIIGLLNLKEFKKGQALLLKPCNQIHTFFMRFSIDALFLDRENRIIKIIKNLRPWRISGVCLKARSCLELPAGIIDSTSTREGDLLSISS